MHCLDSSETAHTFRVLYCQDTQTSPFPIKGELLSHPPCARVRDNLVHLHLHPIHTYTRREYLIHTDTH